MKRPLREHAARFVLGALALTGFVHPVPEYDAKAGERVPQTATQERIDPLSCSTSEVAAIIDVVRSSHAELIKKMNENRRNEKGELFGIEVTAEQALFLAACLQQRIIDLLPLTDQAPLTEQSLQAIASEIMPELVTQNNGESLIQLGMQPEVSLVTYGNIFAILSEGESNCTDFLALSDRVLGDDEWAHVRRPRAYMLVAHELAHLHQGALCAERRERDELEVAAQLWALETLAAMGRAGNVDAMIGYLAGVQDILLRSALVDRLDHGSPEEVMALLTDLYGSVDAAELARVIKESPQALRSIRDGMWLYANVPLARLFAAVDTGVISSPVIPANSESGFSLADALFVLLNP